MCIFCIYCYMLHYEAALIKPNKNGKTCCSTSRMYVICNVLLLIQQRTTTTTIYMDELDERTRTYGSGGDAHTFIPEFSILFIFFYFYFCHICIYTRIVYFIFYSNAQQRIIHFLLVDLCACLRMFPFLDALFSVIYVLTLYLS